MSKRTLASMLTLTAVLTAAIAAVGQVGAEKRRARTASGPNVQKGAPPAGGPDCNNATPVGTLPFTDTDNSCGAPQVVNDYFNAVCNSVLYPGPELIYAIDLGASNQVQITLTPTAPADLALFVVDDCDTPTTCVGFLDIIGGGAPEIVAPGQTVNVPGFGDVTYPPIGAGTYYIYVDSYYASGPGSCGDYQLQVDGTKPVELMKFAVD